MYLRIIMLLLFIALTGCTYFRSNHSFIQDRDTDYLRAHSIAPLKIPPGLSSDRVQNHYPIPEKNYPVAAKNPSLIPPGL